MMNTAIPLETICFINSETYENAKVGVVEFFKDINNITNVTSGVARGVAEGIGVTAIVGVVGKAISEAKDEKGLKVIAHIVGQTVKDFAKGAWETIKFIPSVITKSPLENIKTISSLPKKFFAKEYAVNEQALKGYLSGHGKVAAIATAVGLGVLAFRTIQGKINANEKNADLDHKTNLGHV